MVDPLAICGTDHQRKQPGPALHPEVVIRNGREFWIRRGDDDQMTWERRVHHGQPVTVATLLELVRASAI